MMLKALLELITANSSVEITLVRDTRLGYKELNDERRGNNE